jgi:predicted methyltransferase
MRLLTLLCASALSVATALNFGGCAHQNSTAVAAVKTDAEVSKPTAELTQILTSPARSGADRERDLRDNPLAVLSFAGFKAGDRIADIFGGGGYYSEILSNVVGKSGRVQLINNQPYHEYAKADLEPRLASGNLQNVDYTILPSDNMALKAVSFDGALIVMAYHDLYVSDPTQGWPPIDAAQFIDQLAAALKPGAVLLIVDHAAKNGSAKQNTQALHRIDEEFTKVDFAAHGFAFEASLEVLRNADDDRSKGVFDAAIKGKTDRFVHRYRKL